MSGTGSPLGGGFSRPRPVTLPAVPRTTPVTIAPRRTTATKYVPLAQTKIGQARTKDAQAKALLAQAGQQRGPRSLVRQFSDSATGIITGIPALIKTGIKSTPIYMGVQAASDKFGSKGQVRPIEQLDPLADQVSTSVGNTYGRFRHPSRYVKAVKEGRIVDAVLEDATNASLAAAPAAKVLGLGAEAAEGAGLSRTATVLGGLEKGANLIHTVGERVTNAPMEGAQSLLRTGLSAGREGSISLLDSLSSLDRDGGVSPDAPASVRLANKVLPKFQGVAETLRDVAPLKLRDEGIAMKGAVRDASTAAPRAFARAGRDLFTDAGIKTAEDAGRTAEQGAAVALMNGVGGVDELLRRSAPDLDPEQIRQMHTTRDIPEQTLTPDVADVVRKYQDGSLDPAAQQRIEQYQDAVSKQMAGVQERAVAGAGRVKGTLDQQQLGNAPIDQYVMKGLADAGVPSHLLDVADRARSIGIPWTDLEKAIPELTDVLDNPQSYPKAWRPAMQAAAMGNQALGELTADQGGPRAGIGSHRPDALMAQGIERPQYFSSADSDIAQPKRVRIGRERVNEGTTGVRGVTSENQALHSEIQPYSARTMAESLGRESSQTAYNEHFLAGVEKAGLPKVHEFLEPETMSRIEDVTRRQVAAQRLGEGSSAARAIMGRNIVEELKGRGFSVIEGDINNPQVGDFNPDSGVRYDQISKDSTVLPTGVKNKLVQYWAEKGGGVPARVIDWINKKFKGNVLPFSVRWQVGDMVGGAFMAWVGGGMNPAELAAGMQHMRKLSPEAADEILNHPDWADASLSQGDRQLMQTGPDAPTPRTPIGKAKQASFKLNNAINRVNRNGYLVARVDDLLAKKGLTIESVDGAGAWKDPEIVKAVSAAVDDATKVMGSFDEMTPFEQRYMKRAFPFYAWNRHITGLALNTLIDNPARIAWTLRLGSYGTDPSQELPQWLRGSIGLGSQLYPTNFVNPFNDVGGGDPIYTPTGAIKSLSPAIKLPIVALTGLDPSKGLAPVTRPGGSQQKGITPFYGLRDPAALAYQAAQSFPAARVGISLAPTSNIGGIGLGPHPRYGSGDTIVDKATGQPIATTPRLNAGASLFGLPAPTSMADAADIQGGAPSSATRIGAKVRLAGKAKSRKVKLR